MGVTTETRRMKVLLVWALANFAAAAQDFPCLPGLNSYKANTTSYVDCSDNLAVVKHCAEGKFYSGIKQTCSEKSDDHPQINTRMKVLGRPMQLGSLYDARKDIFVPISFWNMETIEKNQHIDDTQQSVNTKVSASNSISDRMSHMNL